MVVQIDHDNGFGQQKAIGLTEWCQPSVLGEAAELFDNSIRPDDVQIWVDGKHYFVGNLALRHSLIPYFCTGDDKASSWMTRIFIRAAIGATAPGDQDINMVTGLPISYYHRQKSEFSALLDELKTPHSFDIQIGEVKTRCCPWLRHYKIVPQPFGAAMNYLLDSDGRITDQQAAQGKILVVDIGYYTLDLLVLDRMEIGKQSHSPEHLGIDTAYQIITAQLRQQIGRAPGRQELDGYVRAGMYEGVNIVPIRQQAFRALASQIQAEIDSLNARFDRYIVTGGWASEIAPMLSIPNPVVMDGMGNVRGYRKIGVRLWQNTASGCAPAKTATL